MKQLNIKQAVFALLVIATIINSVHAKAFGSDGSKYQQNMEFSSDGEDGISSDQLVLSLLKEAEKADQIGDVGRVLDLLRQASSIDTSDVRTRITIFQHLGAAESMAGNIREALAARDMAESLSGSGKHLAGKRLNALSKEIDLQLKLGDTDAAKRSLARAETAMSFLGSNRNWQAYHTKWIGNLEQGRGDIAQAEGRYVDAEMAFRRSLKEFEEFRVNGAKFGSENDILQEAEGAERNVENMLTKLAYILQLQGRLAEAQLYARQLVERAQLRQGSNSFASGRGHRVMSVIFSERGLYTDAEREARAAIADLKGAGVLPFAFNMVHAQQALAVSLAGQEKWHDAAIVFAEAKDVLQADPVLHDKLGLGSPHWALTLIQVGDPERAIAMLEKMLVKQLKLQPETAFQPSITRGLLGLAQYFAGQENLAEASFRLAVPSMLENIHQLTSEDQGTSASEIMTRKIVDGYIDLLIHRYQAQRTVPSGDPLNLAFRYADMASANSVRHAVAVGAARSSLGNAELAEMVRREQDMSQRISTFGQTLEHLNEMRDQQLVQSSIDLMRQDIEQTRSARIKLRNDIARRFPSYIGLINPRTPSISEIANLLQPDEAFISIHPTDNKTYVWLIRSGLPPSYAAIDISKSNLDDIVNSLRKALDPGSISLEQTPAFDVNAAYQLYHRLLGSLNINFADTKKLIVVTPGSLGRLPFGLLVTETPSVVKPMIGGNVLFSEYQHIPWLIRRCAISNLPSASNFSALRLNLTPLAKQSFAGFGDPLFSAKQTSGGTTRGASHLRNLSIIKSSNTVFNAEQSGVIPNEISLLPPLPETRDEILAIANVLHADIAHDVFLEAYATEAAVRQINLIDRRVVAFSTHGLVPGELSGLDSPALALTAPELASTHEPNDNGFLTLEKILPLKLNAELVVLSACNTAAGDGAGAEAFSGLGRAFFFAGARSILVSHWPVESQATEKLITQTLRNYAANQISGRAEALQKAELELIDGEPVKYGNKNLFLAHPLFWSAFSLVGEGGLQK